MSNNLPSNELLVFGRPWMKYIFFISSAGFIGLTALVVYIPFITIDHWFSLEVQKHGNTFFDVFMTVESIVGHFTYSIPLVPVTALVFFVFKFTRESLFVLLTLLSGLVSTVVKYLVNRPRPAKNVVRVIEVTRQQSFPSGHVLFYTVLFGFLVFLMLMLKKIPLSIRLIVATFCLCIIVLVLISRIYLGAHWLTDVLAGYLLGYCLLYLLIQIYFNRYKLL